MDNRLELALQGDELSISKVLTSIESFSEKGFQYLEELMGRGGKAHVIGITGMPGAGKSTLISALIGEFIKRNRRVGVIMVDPSSPYSKGSFMGNRIRMQDKALEENVFIRSLASRGNLGGVSAESLMLIEAMDGLGFDHILVETVGAGQTDTEVVSTAHTVTLVTIPGAGDEIQALKAGIMEIGDIYIVNKSELPGSEQAYNFLKFSLETQEVNWRYGWKPKVIMTSAVTGKGIPELVDMMEEHEKFSRENTWNEIISLRRKKMVELIVRKKVDDTLKKSIEDLNGELERSPLRDAMERIRSSLKSNL